MNKKGFTLVEIMIVVAIIALLVAIAIPAFLKNRRDAQGNACVAQLDQIYSAKEQLAFKLDLAKADQGWPVGDPAEIIDAYLRGFSLADGLNACPSGGTYALGSSVVNDDGFVVVPTCSLESEDPDNDGLTYGQEGLHIHRRSFVRQSDGTYERDSGTFLYAE